MGIRYLSKRILQRTVMIVPVVLMAITIVFLISRLVPSDPARLIAGQFATEDQVQQIRAEYNLDKPILLQYLLYLRDILHADFGTSMHTRRPVIEDIKEFYPATIELAMVSMLLVIVIGVPLGIVSAVRKDTIPDHFSRLFALSGVSIPVFWLGIVLQLLLFYSLGLLPIGGRLTYGIALPQKITGFYILDSLVTCNWTAFFDAIHHIILPAIVLSTSSMSSVVRQTRAEMLKVLKEDYIVFHNAYGLPRRQVVYKYALRNALTPTISIIGLVFGLLMGGSFLVEAVFNWPGIGNYVAMAILTSDFPAIVGATLFITFIYAFVNLVVDVLYMVINPKVRV